MYSQLLRKYLSELKMVTWYDDFTLRKYKMRNTEINDLKKAVDEHKLVVFVDPDFLRIPI